MFTWRVSVVETWSWRGHGGAEVTCRRDFISTSSWEDCVTRPTKAGHAHLIGNGEAQPWLDTRHKQLCTLLKGIRRKVQRNAVHSQHLEVTQQPVNSGGHTRSGEAHSLLSVHTAMWKLPDRSRGKAARQKEHSSCKVYREPGCLEGWGFFKSWVWESRLTAQDTGDQYKQDTNYLNSQVQVSL